MSCMKQHAADLVEQNLDDTIWDAEIAAGASAPAALVLVAREVAPAASDLELQRAALALAVDAGCMDRFQPLQLQ